MPKSECSLEDRTINLAKEGNSLEERKLKLLICERNKPIKPQCGATLPVGVTSTPCSAKKIKVCSGTELREKCCPKPLPDCPIPPPSKSPLRYLAAAAKTGVKCAVAAGVVYWTYSIGLWGDADKTERLYLGMRNLVYGEDCTPETYGRPENCQPPSPISPYLQKARTVWNSNVTYAFDRMGYYYQKLEARIAGPITDSQNDANCTIAPTSNKNKKK